MNKVHDLRPLVCLFAEYYSDMSITQLGLVVYWLAIIRATLGHEGGDRSLESYIHVKHLPKDIYQCVDFLQREVMGIKKSKYDIDFTKYGNKGEFRREFDLPEGKEVDENPLSS